MTVNITNKKYAILHDQVIHNQDILITENGNYYPSDEYTGFNLVRVNIPEPNYEEITIVPSIISQEFIPEEGRVYTKIFVKAVTADIDNNIKPENILKNIEILGVKGTVEFLTEELFVEPQTNKQTFKPSKDGFNKVSIEAVTSKIDDNITEGNIKKDIEILGVRGSLIPSNETTRDIYVNGSFTPEEPYTGFSEVRVDVKLEQEELIVNPSTEEQTFTSEDKYHGYSPIIVKPVTFEIDSNIKPINIRKDTTILGITGTLEELLGEIREETLIKETLFTPSEGYNGITQIKVSPTLLNLEINPSVQIQNYLVPDEYTGYGELIINPVTSSIDSNILAENIKKDVTILGVKGTCVETLTTDIAITENGIYEPETPYTGFDKVTVDINTVNNTTLSITPQITTQEFAPEEPYTGFETVSVKAVTSDIDANIIPTNIKSGIEILGVTGSVTELSGQTKTITANGTYTPDEGYNAITSVIVDINTVNNTDITITDNGEFTPEEPYTGFGKVTVDVSSKLEEVTVTPQDTITTILPSEGNIGLSKVIVDLTWVEEALKAINAGDTETTVVLQDLTITQAGTYAHEEGFDGLGTVTVNLDWVEEAIENAKLETINGNADQLIEGNALSIATEALLVRKYAFAYNTNLTKVVLNSAISIDEFAFTETNLTTLIINSESMCALADVNAFSTTPIIYVPDELLAEYQAAENWSALSENIQPLSNL